MRATIHCFPEGPQGWIEVDPFDYEYTGPDPDGEVESYLAGVANGDIQFYFGVEEEPDDPNYPPALILMELKTVLKNVDPIWFVELPDDYENPITYG